MCGVDLFQVVGGDTSRSTFRILEDLCRMPRLSLSSKLNWGSCIISVAKTVSRKPGALIHSIKFHSPEVTLYPYKSILINLPCSLTWNSRHVWAGDPSYYLEMSDKLQKQICKTVGPSLAASLEPLAHCWNAASLSPWYRFYFGRCSSELDQLVPHPYSRGWSTSYSDGLHDFSITIPRCFKDFYVNSFFLRTARLWNSLLIECFPLTFDLSGL